MAQVSVNSDLGFTSMGQHLYLVHVTGVVLTSGAGTINVPCDQIQHVIAQSTKQEATNDYVLNHDYTFAGNTITVTVKKQQLSATNTWGEALTADISDSVYDFLVIGI